MLTCRARIPLGGAEKAEEARQALGSVQLVTTQEVLTEVLNEFSEKRGRHLRELTAGRHFRQAGYNALMI